MTGANLSEQVQWVVANETGNPPTRITMNTRIQSDLGVAGDDGEDLLVRFQKEFSVDMSSLRYDKHFEPEGVPLGYGLLACIAAFTSALFWWLIPIWLVLFYFRMQWPWSGDLPGEILVSDLVRSARLGRWDYPYDDRSKISAVCHLWERPTPPCAS